MLSSLKAKLNPKKNRHALAILAEFSKDIGETLVRNAVSAFIGKDCPFTETEAAELLGENERTIQSWRVASEQATPPTWKFLRMCVLLGPDFLNAILRPMGMEGVRWIGEAKTTDLEVAAEAAHFVSLSCAARLDGKLSHDEIAAMLPDLRHMNALSGTLLAEYERQIASRQAGRSAA